MASPYQRCAMSKLVKCLKYAIHEDSERQVFHEHMRGAEILHALACLDLATLIPI
jgi:hypothetical protein